VSAKRFAMVVKIGNHLSHFMDFFNEKRLTRETSIASIIVFTQFKNKSFRAFLEKKEMHHQKFALHCLHKYETNLEKDHNYKAYFSDF